MCWTCWLNQPDRMLTVSRLSKSFGGQILFEDASLQVNRGDRIALIGPNGAGKTTLLSILLELDDADTGEVALQRGVKVGFLPQESAPVSDETVLQVATALPRDRRSKDQELLDNEVSFSSDLQQIEAKAKRILRGLGFRETDYARQAKTMSGGWIMRAHLARLLVTEPDLLLLDEPTNHLDLESLVWLQSYFSTYSGRDSPHLARPLISERPRRANRRDRSTETDIVPRQLRRICRSESCAPGTGPGCL